MHIIIKVLLQSI